MSDWRFNPDPSLYPDPTGRAARVCAFTSRLKLWEGDKAGERLELARFQIAMIRRIYGPSTSDGRRLVRLACIWMPRASGKTTLISGTSLCHFMGPEAEAGGQVVMAAADRENAGIGFNAAWQFVQADPALAERVEPIESRKVLKHPGTKSTLKAISTEAYSKHGLNVSFFLADEVHAWPPAEARKLFKVVTDSMGKRREPLTVVISTVGEGSGGLAYDLWQYSLKVACGEIEDPTFAPIIFAADPESDWRDEAVWLSCNPAIDAGFSSLEELRIKARRIEHFPAEVADFKRFNLNIWQDGASLPWIPAAVYDAAVEPKPVAGRRCYVGIDLASVEDLAAVVALFPDGDGEDAGYDVVAKFFLPADSLKAKAENDRADYLRWAAEGHLVLTEGNVIDHDAVIAHVVELAEEHDVAEVGVDRWNSTAVTVALMNQGLTVATFGQGYASMSAPVRELKRAILARAFRHGGNPVLRMCFANVAVERDAAGNEKFTKSRARGRIDGAVAAAIAVGRALANAGEVSIFERAELWTQPAKPAPAPAWWANTTTDC